MAYERVPFSKYEIEENGWKIMPTTNHSQLYTQLKDLNQSIRFELERDTGSDSGLVNVWRTTLWPIISSPFRIATNST